jgi:hypothetical protein
MIAVDALLAAAVIMDARNECGHDNDSCGLLSQAR